MERRERILNILETRKITQLIHFTKRQNVNSILNNGLLSLQELKKRNLEYVYNDPERRDDWNYAISLSITYKNSFLFESFKRRQKLNDSDFVEIKIDPSVIVENECIFCDTNAASHTFDQYRQNDDELAMLKTWLAFDGMFKETVKRHTLNERGKIKRFNQKPNETTCSQAEICLIGNIQPEKFINLEEYKILSFWDKVEQIGVWKWSKKYPVKEPELEQLLDGYNETDYF